MFKAVRDKLWPFIMSNYWFDFIIVMEVSIQFNTKWNKNSNWINRKTVSIIVYARLFVCLFASVYCDNCSLKVFSCGRITIVVQLINTMQRFTTNQMNWQSHIVLYYRYIHYIYIRTGPNLCYISSSLIFFNLNVRTCNNMLSGIY